MGQVHYQVVPHEGGWSYRLDDTYSSVYRSRSEAAEAARTEAIAMLDSKDDTKVLVLLEDGSWDDTWSFGLPSARG